MLQLLMFERLRVSYKPHSLTMHAVRMHNNPQKCEVCRTETENTFGRLRACSIIPVCAEVTSFVKAFYIFLCTDDADVAMICCRRQQAP
jgi:hypothetical protein